MVNTRKLPFEVSKQDSFIDKLGEWIGDVFYELLPDAGYEIRDEQIFMAYQVERAFKEKKIIFAEAGVGTGKTFVYLLYSICYARYTGKPAIIACADESLIEQLVKKNGDIEKLSKALNLDVDVRLAKSPTSYLCLNKLDEQRGNLDASDKVLGIYENLPSFVHDYSTLQAFYPYGDRTEHKDLTDEEWGTVGYDYFQDCATCEKRHRCGQTLSRDQYRKATDLIVCSQDFYMEHIWTADSRKREGQLPLLPSPSCVVFDEGHLLEFAAQKSLTYRLQQETLNRFFTHLMQTGTRETFRELLEDTLETYDEFFYLLDRESKMIKGSNRLEVNKSDEIIRTGEKIRKQIAQIGDELVFESEMYTMDEYQLNIVDEHLDDIEMSLNLFLNEKTAILWLEEYQNELTLVIMPRAVNELLQEKVFSLKIPMIFSSATLSENNSFDYISNSLGVKEYLSFSVNSPFEYEELMKIDVIQNYSTENALKNDSIIKNMNENKGSTLVLFNSVQELNEFKLQTQNESMDFPIYFEGQEEISTLVSKFQNEIHSVLCAVHLWEGLDIQGESLNQVIIHSLPFPPNDPVFQAKRNSVNNWYEEVDEPYMLLRLRQGIGRLIRSNGDSGKIMIYVDSNVKESTLQKVHTILPVKANNLTIE
ncbi:ATP-dependent DNA helicase [Bacillus sp. RG28]|uniref:ATP-dependent DNA helicase n=1 Tax=Gottfriedia endophytica TaxID=2820819 RepID=A0A940NNV7_9BACI|nr:ATP-dependent DNA helicase [Gottfriedia endophytica]MBP0724166.1 ATP-dependent DNA helicase [Gottfriedia endophytica]